MFLFVIMFGNYIYLNSKTLRITTFLGAKMRGAGVRFGIWKKGGCGVLQVSFRKDYSQ